MTKIRTRGRAVPSAGLPAATGRPAEWGNWEWRDWTCNPNHKQVRAHIAETGDKMPTGLLRACLNNIFSVMFFRKHSQEWGEIDHIMIRRHDQGTGVSWAEKQRIKDELIGPERTAIEVYPARSDLVDNANIYHLWILPEGVSLSFTI